MGSLLPGLSRLRGRGRSTTGFSRIASWRSSARSSPRPHGPRPRRAPGSATPACSIARRRRSRGETRSRSRCEDDDGGEDADRRSCTWSLRNRPSEKSSASSIRPSRAPPVRTSARAWRRRARRWPAATSTARAGAAEDRRRQHAGGARLPGIGHFLAGEGAVGRRRCRVADCAAAAGRPRPLRVSPNPGLAREVAGRRLGLG